MTFLHAIRHAPTEYNKSSKIMGDLNIPIDGNCLAEIRKTKELLCADYKVDVCYTSPLARAHETAQLLFDSDVVPDGRLIGKSIGDLKGKSLAEIKAIYPQAVTPANVYNFLFDPPNGESAKDTVRRVYGFLQSVLSDGRENVAIVSHSVFLSLIYVLTRFLPLEKTMEFTQDFLEIRTYEICEELLAKIREFYGEYFM